MTAWICSSRNNMVATTMSPRAISSRQCSSAAGLQLHSSAAWIARSSPGNSAHSVARAREAADARWLSIVTMTTRMGVLSAAEMRFGIVQGLESDQGEVTLLREPLGVAASLAAHEEWNLVKLLLRLRRPAGRHGRRQFDRNMRRREA